MRGGRSAGALNGGAAKGGFAHDTGEGSISRYHREPGGDLIWEIGSGYFGCRDEQGNFSPDRFVENAKDPQVKMIELKLSQGAKPGHGGVLPGPKVTIEIAKARGVKVDENKGVYQGLYFYFLGKAGVQCTYWNRFTLSFIVHAGVKTPDVETWHFAMLGNVGVGVRF